MTPSTSPAIGAHATSCAPRATLGRRSAVIPWTFLARVAAACSGSPGTSTTYEKDDDPQPVLLLYPHPFDPLSLRERGNAICSVVPPLRVCGEGGQGGEDSARAPRSPRPAPCRSCGSAPCARSETRPPGTAAGRRRARSG